MPAPEKTTVDAIVLAAREILETEGLAGLTMQAVADRVGVRAPSLYKRVRSRDQLIRLTAEASLADLATRLESASGLPELARAFRRFGHERPAAFQLMMSSAVELQSARAEFFSLASAPLLRQTAELVGEANGLEAARTLTAWASGFIAMELNGGFNLGGDVERAWEYGLATVVGALSPGAAPRPSKSGNKNP